jgi:hypothetical protein
VLTAKGVKRIEAAVPKHIDHLEELFTGILDATERAALEGALRKLRDALNPCATAGAEPASAAHRK